MSKEDKQKLRENQENYHLFGIYQNSFQNSKSLFYKFKYPIKEDRY